MQPGDALLALVRGASRELILVAPFIKTASLERVFAAIPDSVENITCVTRWLPEDIAAGVCDLEILDTVSARSGAALFVHPLLHAKYFRASTECLVGSANLTHRGLGWVTPSNVELLVPIPFTHPSVAEWETALLGAVVQATPDLRERIDAQAKKLGQISALDYARTEVGPSETSVTLTKWIPLCPTPDRLWLVYNGKGEETMVTSAYEAACSDLSALSIPQGLSKPLFDAYVAGVLQTVPILTEIRSLASTGLPDSAAHEFLSAQIGQAIPTSAEQAWHTLKTWIMHFFPGEFRLQAGQEVLIRGQTLKRP